MSELLQLINIDEIWEDIKNYEGIYKISSHGRILSCDRLIRRKCRWGGFNYIEKKSQIISSGKDRDGYMIVGLYKEGTGKTHKVHRLVADHFVPNQNKLPHVNHLDFNRQNNIVSNLEWTNSSENSKYSAVNNPQAYINRSTIHFRLHERESILKMHYVYGIPGKIIADIYNRKPRTIYRIINNRVHNQNHITL